MYCWIKITPKCSSLKQKSFTISQSFCGSGVWEQLSWVALAQSVSGGCSQSVGWGSSHLKLDWGWRIWAQDCSLTWLLAKGISSSLAVHRRLWFLAMWMFISMGLPDCPQDMAAPPRVSNLRARLQLQYLL